MISQVPDRIPEFDEDGFILSASAWDDAVAKWIARQDGISHLTEKHWEFIRCLRDYYSKFGALPSLHHLCHMSHQNERDFDKLFGNSFKEACRIAGIPNPGEEAKSYM